MITEIVAGDTRQFTWINSGVTPSAISLAIYSGSETLVNSVSASSSGNGHYYANYTVSSTTGFYSYYWNATISSNPYVRAGRFKVIAIQVD